MIIVRTSGGDLQLQPNELCEILDTKGVRYVEAQSIAPPCVVRIGNEHYAVLSVDARDTRGAQ